MALEAVGSNPISHPIALDLQKSSVFSFFSLFAKTPDERAAIKQLMKQERLFEAAHMSEAMLGSEAFIDKLVKNDGSLVEKLFEKFKRLKESLSSIGDAEARAELSRIRKAERLYLKAAEKAGNKELARRLRGYVDEDKEANSQTSGNLDAEERDADSEQSSDTERTDGQKENASEGAVQYERNGVLTEGQKIVVGINDSERAKILRSKIIKPAEIKQAGYADLDWNSLEKNRKSAVEKSLIKKLRDYGYLKAYKTESVDVEFEFTGGGVRKSLNSQVSDYGGTLADFAKVVLNMQNILDSSVLIEIHNDKAKGTDRENQRLLQTYVLLSAFVEEKYITPVQFEIKQYIDNENRLYLAVALTKIEKMGVVDDTAPTKGERTRLLPISDISISQLIKKSTPEIKISSNISRMKC